MVMVLAISFLLVGLVAASLAATRSSASISYHYQSNTLARLDAESGIALALYDISTSTSVATLPCSFSPASANYSVTVTYDTGSSPLACTGNELGGTTAPTAAKILSAGTPSGNGSVEMEDDLLLSSPNVLQSAYDYAMYSPGYVEMSNDTTVDAGPGGAPADVYAGSYSYCTNNDIVQGTLIINDWSGTDISVNCQVSGNLIVNGSFSISNNVAVGGSAEAIDGSLTISNDVTIGGNAYSVGGLLQISGGSSGKAIVDGSAFSDGESTSCGGYQASIALCTNQAEVLGSAYGSGAIYANTASSGTVAKSVVANTPVSGMPTMPVVPQVSWSTLSNLTAAQWQGAGYSVVNIPSTSCSSYFSDQYLKANNYKASASQLNVALNAATTKTVFYAPSCSVDLGTNVAGGAIFNLHSDVVLVASTVSEGGSSTTFESSNSQAPNLTIIGTSATGGLSFQPGSNYTTTFAPSVNVLLFTPGTVSVSGVASMTGQILAGTSITTSNDFTLTFSSAAASSLPGTTSVGAPQVTSTNEFLKRD